MSSQAPVYTTSNGAPANEPYSAQRAGIGGPLLLQGKYINYSRRGRSRLSDLSQTSTISISSRTSIASVSLSVLSTPKPPARMATSRSPTI